MAVTRDIPNTKPHAYLKAIYDGGVDGVVDIGSAFLDPINKIIFPPFELAYDVAIAGLPIMGRMAAADPVFAKEAAQYSHELLELSNMANKNPQIVEDAEARLSARLEMLKAVGKEFVAGDGPERTEMATRLIVNIFSPSVFIKSLKMISNVRKFGAPFDPPKFQNLEKFDSSNLPSMKHWSLPEIRNQWQLASPKNFFYVIKPNGKLLITDFSVAGHPELAWPGSVVIAAGEVQVVAGKIVKINNASGHFRPCGPNLGKYVETVFKNNGYNEASGLFQYLDIRSTRLLQYGRFDTMLAPPGFHPSLLETAAGTTIAATRDEVPSFDFSSLFTQEAHAEEMGHSSFSPQSQGSVSLPPAQKEETAIPAPQQAQQPIDAVEKSLEEMLTSFGNIVAASEALDIRYVKDMPGVQEEYDEIQDLKLQQRTRGVDLALTAEISQRTRALKARIMPELDKREAFTEKLRYASDTVTGAAGILSAIDSELAQQIMIVGSSAITVVDQASALLGIGMSAATMNPVAVIGAIVNAVTNIANVFRKKPQDDPNAVVLKAITMLFERIAEFERSMRAEFTDISSDITDTRWQVLTKLAEIKDHQHDVLSFLNHISIELSRTRDQQNSRLLAHSDMLSKMIGNLAATPYRELLDALKERIRYVSRNTLLKDYNGLMNELDHLGLQKNVDNALIDLFDIEATKPASYLQARPYFTRLILSILLGKNHDTMEMERLPSPFPLMYASHAKMMCGYTQYPKPDAAYTSSCIAERDIKQLAVYDAELADIEKLTQQASQVLDKMIAAYQAAAVDLRAELVEEMHALESSKTSEIYHERLTRLSLLKAEEKERFSEAAYDVDTHDWFKGTETHEERSHSNRKWRWTKTEVPYVDEVQRQQYLAIQKRYIQSAKSDWSTSISRHRLLAGMNHLSATAPVISSYHGAGFLKPTQSGSPYLPAPDPLIPVDHPQFEVMRVLQEAQAYGLGSIELFYTACSETKIFEIEIRFRGETIAFTKEPIAILQFPYDPLLSHNRAEAIWYEFVGNPVFVSPGEGEMSSRVSGHKITGQQAVNGGGSGHNRGEFRYTEWETKVPKPATNRVGKLTQLQDEHDIPCVSYTVSVQDPLLASIKVSIQEARQRFVSQIRERLSHSLDDAMQNKLGLACRVFEQAYRHLYGVLSYAYFDEMQNSYSHLAKWFASHATHIRQLRSALSTNAPQDVLSTLIDDLPKLQKILSDLSTHGSHFHLLSETRAALHDFFVLYEPFAVKHNAEVPPLDQSETVKKQYNSIVLDLVAEILDILPPDQAIPRIQKILNKQTLTDEERLATEEILKRLQDGSNARGLALPASSSVLTSPATMVSLQQACKDLPQDLTLEATKELCDSLFGPNQSMMQAQALCKQQSPTPLAASNTWAGLFNRACHFVMSGGQQSFASIPSVSTSPLPAVI
ncbi:MAG TPA: hypothetical protein VNC84_07830 [Gammaproteobacteria bacterium]|jgi:hypothetical protein|nr:hypothetical protein [Gammaproteobacteria bacterium]